MNASKGLKNIAGLDGMALQQGEDSDMKRTREGIRKVGNRAGTSTLRRSASERNCPPRVAVQSTVRKRGEEYRPGNVFYCGEKKKGGMVKEAHVRKKEKPGASSRKSAAPGVRKGEGEETVQDAKLQGSGCEALGRRRSEASAPSSNGRPCRGGSEKRTAKPITTGWKEERPGRSGMVGDRGSDLTQRFFSGRLGKGGIRATQDRKDLG